MAKIRKKKFKLVIVESPAKAKTIGKYLDKDFKVISCMGHLIDLPKSRMGIDFENGFEPDYVTVRGKGKLLQEIKRYGKDSSEVFLASDEDREGEAIAFHLQRVLKAKYPELPIHRISFHEITRDVILEAVNNPKTVDLFKVNAQKARRVLDRIVGYCISPLLWEKVKKGLSAGRVQSVALNLICVREDEILEFKPEEYWSLEMGFHKDGQKKEMRAALASWKGEKAELVSKEGTDEVIAGVEGKSAVVEEVTESKRSRKPLPPYTTSKLQQDAANRLNFSSSKTMMIAQRLYEGIELGGEVTGLITYMRTDSVRVSDVALRDVRRFIAAQYADFLPEAPQEYITNKKAQDAHEAIRPTQVDLEPNKVKAFLSPDEFKLYSIVWERFVSSQMKAMEFANVKVNIKCGEAVFSLTGSVVEFMGYSAAFNVLKADSKSVKLPNFTQGEVVDVIGLFPEQHFTTPPARYSDASIVKMMEEHGIGRPSTYAPTIERLIKKYYAKRAKRQLVPTTLGVIVNNMLEAHFPELMDSGFTAKMEDALDIVAESDQPWNQVIIDFYPEFKATLERARENIKEMKSTLDEPVDRACPECTKPLVKKLGKYGFFIACTGFPACDFTESISLGECPLCDGGKIIARKTRRGREFFGCSRYPTCAFVSWDPPAEQKCEQCGKILFESGNKKKGYLLMARHPCEKPDCKYLEGVKTEEGGE